MLLQSNRFTISDLPQRESESFQATHSHLKTVLSEVEGEVQKLVNNNDNVSGHCEIDKLESISAQLKGTIQSTLGILEGKVENFNKNTNEPSHSDATSVTINAEVQEPRFDTDGISIVDKRRQVVVDLKRRTLVLSSQIENIMKKNDNQTATSVSSGTPTDSLGYSSSSGYSQHHYDDVDDRSVSVSNSVSDSVSESVTTSNQSSIKNNIKSNSNSSKGVGPKEIRRVRFQDEVEQSKKHVGVVLSEWSVDLSQDSGARKDNVVAEQVLSQSKAQDAITTVIETQKNVIAETPSEAVLAQTSLTKSTTDIISDSNDNVTASKVTDSSDHSNGTINNNSSKDTTESDNSNKPRITPSARVSTFGKTKVNANTISTSNIMKHMTYQNQNFGPSLSESDSLEVEANSILDASDVTAGSGGSGFQYTTQNQNQEVDVFVAPEIDYDSDIDNDSAYQQQVSGKGLNDEIEIQIDQKNQNLAEGYYNDQEKNNNKTNVNQSEPTLTMNDYTDTVTMTSVTSSTLGILSEKVKNVSITATNKIQTGVDNVTKTWEELRESGIVSELQGITVGDIQGKIQENMGDIQEKIQDINVQDIQDKIQEQINHIMETGKGIGTAISTNESDSESNNVHNVNDSESLHLPPALIVLGQNPGRTRLDSGNTTPATPAGVLKLGKISRGLNRIGESSQQDFGNNDYNIAQAGNSKTQRDSLEIEIESESQLVDTESEFNYEPDLNLTAKEVRKIRRKREKLLNSNKNKNVNNKSDSVSRNLYNSNSSTNNHNDYSISIELSDFEKTHYKKQDQQLDKLSQLTDGLEQQALQMSKELQMIKEEVAVSNITNGNELPFNQVLTDDDLDRFSEKNGGVNKSDLNQYNNDIDNHSNSIVVPLIPTDINNVESYQNRNSFRQSLRNHLADFREDTGVDLLDYGDQFVSGVETVTSTVEGIHNQVSELSQSVTTMGTSDQIQNNITQGSTLSLACNTAVSAVSAVATGSSLSATAIADLAAFDIQPVEIPNFFLGATSTGSENNVPLINSNNVNNDKVDNHGHNETNASSSSDPVGGPPGTNTVTDDINLVSDPSSSSTLSYSNQMHQNLSVAVSSSRQLMKSMTERIVCATEKIQQLDETASLGLIARLAIVFVLLLLWILYGVFFRSSSWR